MAWTNIDSVTINHLKIPSTQSNYPMWFTLTTNNLKSVGNGGSVTSGSGYDIAFYSDSGATTLLKFERESWDAATGAFMGWVKIASASSSVDTVIYFAYGNSSVTTDQSDANNVWDSNFKAVWHLKGITAPQADSTSNGNNITSGFPPTTAVTKFNGAWDVDDGSAGAYMANSSPTGMPTGTGARTLEMWFNMHGKFAPADNTAQVFGGWGDGGSYYWVISYRNATADKLSLGLPVDVGNGASINWTHDSNWHYVVATSASGNSAASAILMYLDGANVSLASSTGSVGMSTPQISIGSIPVYTNWHYRGYLDEVRISNIDRSADWIATVYNNLNDPATFYTVASVPTGGGVLIAGGMDARMSYPKMLGGTNA